MLIPHPNMLFQQICHNIVTKSFLKRREQAYFLHSRQIDIKYFFFTASQNFFLSRKRSSRAQRGRCKRHIRFIGNAVSYETKKNPILQDSPICFSIFFSGCYLFRNRLQEAVVPKIRDSRATTNESKYSLSALQPAARPAANIVKYPTPNQITI